MLNRFFRYLLDLFNAWRAQEAERAVETAKMQADVKAKIDVISKTSEPRSDDNVKRARKVAKRAKDLGLTIVACILLAHSAQAQTAEERITNLSHDELKIYAQQLVDVSREQNAVIQSLLEENTALKINLEVIHGEIVKLRTGVEKLSAHSGKRKLTQFIEWAVRLSPIAAILIRN